MAAFTFYHAEEATNVLLPPCLRVRPIREARLSYTERFLLHCAYAYHDCRR